MCAKPTTRNWKMRVENILACIAKILQYSDGMTFEVVCADSKTVDAVIRNFEIIGEAASHIPEEIQERYPGLAWLEMRGMRNIMVHEYFGVSLPIIWRTIAQDLEPLGDGLKRILDDQT